MATGPIHGVELITKPLHLAGGMMQAMPSRKDIDRIRTSCESDRLIAAYEILTHHYQSAIQEVETLEAENARLRKGIQQTIEGLDPHLKNSNPMLAATSARVDLKYTLNPEN